jgi:hypothetical protein
MKLSLSVTQYYTSYRNIVISSVTVSGFLEKTINKRMEMKRYETILDCLDKKKINKGM